MDERVTPGYEVQDMFLTRLQQVASAMKDYSPKGMGSVFDALTLDIARACDYCGKAHKEGWRVTVLGETVGTVDIGWYCDSCLRQIPMKEGYLPEWKPITGKGAESASQMN